MMAPLRVGKVETKLPVPPRRRNNTYDSKLNDLIRQILSSNGRTMNDTETHRLKGQLKELPASQAINLLHSSLFPKNQPPQKASEVLLGALLENRRIPFSLKNHLFNEIPLYSRNTEIYHSYMYAADDSDAFEEVKRAFEEMRNRKMATFKSYALIIRSNGRKGLMREAAEAFQEAKDKDLADGRVYAYYIRSLGKDTPFETIQKLFDEAKKRIELDVLVCNAFILQAGKLGQFNQAREVFLELRDRWAADKATYTSFIKVSSINKRYDLAKEAFAEAIEYNYYDGRTLNCYIDVSGKAGHYEEALKAYKISRSKNYADFITYISFINAAAFNGHVREAIAAFNEGIGKFSDCEQIYADFITAMGENGNYEETYRGYRLAIDSEEYHTSIFEAFIRAAGKYGKGADAKDAFDLAEKLQLCDAFVCTKYIDTAALSGNFAEVKRGFNKLVEIERVDSIAISRYMQACQQFREFSEGERGYELSKKLHILDSAIGTNMVDLQREKGDLEGARRILDEIKQLGKSDVRTYNAYLKALTHAEDSNGAAKLLEEMMRLNMDDYISYTLLINMTGLKGRHEEAKKYFELAKSRGHTQVSVYSSFLHSCAKNSKLDEAKAVYREAKNKGYDNNLKLLNNYLTACGNCGDIATVEALYTDITSRFEDNIYTYSSYIAAMGKYGSVEQARKAFSKARKAGLNDTILYSSYMDALRRHKELKEAMEWFHYARDNSLADSRAYNCYINCYPPDLDAMAKEALDSNIAGPEVYNSLMRIESERRNFARVQELFDLVRERKKFNQHNYAIFIDIAGKMKQFEAAERAYKEALKIDLHDVLIFNCFMYAAKLAGRDDLVNHAFETAKRLGLADPFTFSIIINTKIDRSGATYQEVFSVLEECKALRILDTVVYINCIKAAAKMGKLIELKKLFEEAKAGGFVDEELYCAYIGALTSIARSLKVQVQDPSKELPFDTIRSVFVEAKASGFYSEDLLVQYIDSAAKFGRFEEAEEGLVTMFQNGQKTEVIRQAVQNWKIIHSLKAEKRMDLPLDGNRSLFTPCYQLWARFKERRKADLPSLPATLPETPKKLLEKVDTPFPIVDREGKNPSFIHLKEIFQNLASKAQEQKVGIDDGYLGGGAAGYCLPQSVYESAFEMAAGKSDAPFFNDEHKDLLAALYEERFETRPNDWDFKFTLAAKRPEKVEAFPANLDLELSAKTGLKPNDAKLRYSHKIVFINKDGNTFALRRLVDAAGEAYEFVWASQFARNSLFISDAIQIPLGRITHKKAKKAVEVQAVRGSLQESLIYCLLKRLKAFESETINEFGFASYLSKIATGWLGDDEKLEAEAIHAFVNLPDVLPLLESTRDNHLNKSTEGTLALVFNLCSMLIRHGYVLEVETLVSKLKLLFQQPSRDPFFRILQNLWIANSCPFMEIKAAVEAVGLLSFPRQTKIDEHLGEQILQFTHQGYSFLLPIAPANTCTALGLSSHMDEIKKLMQAVPPSLDLTASAIGCHYPLFNYLNNLTDREMPAEPPELLIAPVPEESQKAGWIKTLYLWGKSWF